jgi:very-short-patch-repair endonuclease
MIKLADKEAFELFIKTENIGDKRSLRFLERKYKLSNGTLSKWCIRHGIKPLKKSIASSVAIKDSYANGRVRWNKGKTKDTCEALKRVSDKRKINNPMFNRESIKKMVISSADHARINPPLSEKLFMEFCEESNIPVTHQYVIDDMAFDFRLDGYNLLIEIDGRGHYDRVDSDTKKSFRAVKLGWVVLRIPFDQRAYGFDFGGAVIENLISNRDVFSIDPSSTIKKHRMVICHTEGMTTIKRNIVDGMTIISLIHSS